MGILNGADAKESRRRRRSELLLIGVVGLIGYVGIQGVRSETGKTLVLVALGLAVVFLVVAVGLLVVQMKDPVAKERLVGLVRYARPKIPLKPGE